jgi:hypothetical protein
LGYLHPPPSPAPVIVQKDVGGLVSDYKAVTEMYRRENREVRLHECRSACTLALSLPNVCVYPSSVLKFHAAYHRDTKQVDPGISSELFNAYPQAVKARLGYLTREYRSLSGRELIALGVRDCSNSQGETTIARARVQQPTQIALAQKSSSPVAGLVDGVRSIFGTSAPQPRAVTAPRNLADASLSLRRSAPEPREPDPPTPPPRPANLDGAAQPNVRIAYARLNERPVASDAEPVFVQSRPMLMAGAASILPITFTPYRQAHDR